MYCAWLDDGTGRDWNQNKNESGSNLMNLEDMSS